MKLKSFKQVTREVTDYYTEMTNLLGKAKMEETDPNLQVRFLDGLNMTIRHQVQLQTYDTIQEMVRKACLIEEQEKEKRLSRVSKPTPKYQTYNPNPSPRNNYPNTRSLNQAPYQKTTTSNTKPTEAKKYEAPKNKTETPNQRASQVVCFRCQGRGHYAAECPNKRAMVVNERSGEIESEGEEDEELAGTYVQPLQESDGDEEGTMNMFQKIGNIVLMVVH